MKNFIQMKNAVSIVVAAFLSGCSLLEGNFSGEAEVTFGIYESKAEQNITYSDVRVIDAADDEDIRDNLDKVKDWQVEEISYTIRNYDGDPSATFSGSMGFSRESSTSPTITASVNNLKLNDLNNGAMQKLALSGTDLATMASWLDKDQKIKVYLSGVLSQGPVMFDLVVSAKIKIKAKIF